MFYKEEKQFFLTVLLLSPLFMTLLLYEFIIDS